MSPFAGLKKRTQKLSKTMLEASSKTLGLVGIIKRRAAAKRLIQLPALFVIVLFFGPEKRNLARKAAFFRPKKAGENEKESKNFIRRRCRQLLNKPFSNQKGPDVTIILSFLPF